MYLSLDIETVCDVEGCKGRGDYKRCDHALSPWHSKITVIGLVGSNGKSSVVRGLDSLIPALQTYRDYKLVGHNLKFDLLHLAARGINLINKWEDDTTLMAYVCTEKIPESWLINYNLNRPHKGHREAGKHSLKTLAPYFLGVEPYWETEDKDNDEYVLKDARYSLELRNFFEMRLKDLGQWEFYKEKQLPWTKMLLEAELRGLCVDKEGLAAKEAELISKSTELRSKLDEQWFEAHMSYRSQLRSNLSNKYETMAAKANKSLEYGTRYWKLYEIARSKLPTHIDYHSHKQMLWLLRDHLGYDVKSLDGKDGTGKEILERLADSGKEDVKTYLEWRKVNKLLLAFLPTYKELTVNGTIHPIFNPSNTRTGRTSSERPNMQQVPPELRPLFGPRAGYKFISYDYSGIEAMLIALYSDDPVLYELIKKDISIHDHNTKVFFALDCEHDRVKIEFPIQRAASKNVGFALFYHAGANRIRIAFAQKGFHLSYSESEALLKRFRQSYKIAMDYAKQVVRYLERGQVLEGLLGRPIKIENPDDAYMTGFNTLIQGSASDINLHSAYRVTKRAREAGIDITPVLFVHDNTVFEVREDQAIEADKIINEVFTDYELQTSYGPIKLKIEGGIISRWEK